MTTAESSNIFKAIENERMNFFDSRISFCHEILPYEEGRKLDWLGITKDCSLRRKMIVVASWLNEQTSMSFEHLQEVFKT